jgi:hypothetical protein
MLRRLGAVAGAIAASLAFAASAHAAPSTPLLKPVPTFVCGSSLTVSWTPSAPDPGASIIGYRLDVGDLTAGTASVQWAGGLSATINGLVVNHHYVIRVRALEFRAGALIYSASSARTFQRTCLIISPERLKQYVAYNPWPECIMCGGLEELLKDDPIMERAVLSAKLPAAERVSAVELEADGSVMIL